MSAAESCARSGQGDPEDFLQGGQAAADLVESGLDQGNHARVQSGPPNAVGFAGFGQGLLHGLVHDQKFVDARTAQVSGVKAVFAAPGFIDRGAVERVGRQPGPLQFGRGRGVGRLAVGATGAWSERWAAAPMRADETR